MEIKYFVRTIGNREINIPIDYELIIDKEHKYTKSYIDALYKINDYNAVLMEDDIVLCKNFKEEIEKVINEHPTDIINFFSRPKDYFTTHYTNSFVYNQCTYFPKGLTKLLADEMMKCYIPEERVHRRIQRYGSLLCSVLIQLGIPHINYRPTLVQHIDKNSTYDGLTMMRNTIYFKDYLDEIGIDMTQAYSLENRKKLKELLDADRKKWYGEFEDDNF